LPDLLREQRSGPVIDAGLNPAIGLVMRPSTVSTAFPKTMVRPVSPSASRRQVVGGLT
jgi:hypothetical protein